MTTQPQQPQRAGLYVFALFITLAIILVVMMAIDNGALGWLIGGSVVVIIALVVIVKHVAIPFMDSRIKYVDANYEHERNKMQYQIEMLKLKLDYGHALPAPKPVTEQTGDPRHRLLVDLCLMTIRADKYGPASHRLMTADDAQAASKIGGGQFADRNNWDKASKYAQEKHLVYTKIGGAEQGLMVAQQRVKGDTVSDLISMLMSKDYILDSAVDALPVSER